MKPERQRIKIAEACGWRYVDSRAGYPRGIKDGVTHELPDYLNDLNAMVEAVETLRKMDGPQWWDFQKHLMEICGSTMNCIQATAEQRARAFLETLGLWYD